jgi:hypothetical protein
MISPTFSRTACLAGAMLLLLLTTMLRQPTVIWFLVAVALAMAKRALEGPSAMERVLTEQTDEERARQALLRMRERQALRWLRY